MRKLKHVFEVIRELKAWANHAKEVTADMGLGLQPEENAFLEAAAVLEKEFPNAEASYSERTAAGLPVTE